MRLLPLPVLAFGVLICAYAVLPARPLGIFAAEVQEQKKSVEDIYVVRSVRQSRMAPTSFCDAAKIGFPGANNEDQYILRSMTTNPSDGRVVDKSVQTVGTFHACIANSDPNTQQLYAEGKLGDVPFRAQGECLSNRNYPEGSLVWSHCSFNLSGLPNGYTGGRFTSNSITSPNSLIGENTDPPGYAQSSIATVRLWKRR
jgi:hypothetical protein